MPLNFYATFTNGTSGGVTGLSPLITITRAALANGAMTNIVNGAAMTAITNCSGSYIYNMTAAADLTTFDYFASIISNSTVTQDTPFAASLWSNFGTQAVTITPGTNGGGSVTSGGNSVILPANNASMGISSAGVVNAFGLGFSGSANFSSLVAQLGTLTLNGGISQQAASTNSTGSILFGPPVLFVPVTGTYVNQLGLILRDTSGALINLIAISTQALLPNGVDLGGGVGFTNLSTGLYRFTFTENATNSIAPVTFTFVTTCAGPIHHTLTLTVPAMRLPGQYTTSGTDQYLQTDMLMDAGATQTAGDIVALLTALGDGGLSGPAAITVNFSDSNYAGVPNVDFTIVGQGSSRGNSLGVATFGLPVNTTSGYRLVPRITNNVILPVTDFTVSGTTTVTIIGTGVPAPTMTAEQCYGVLQIIDGEGAVEEDVSVTFQGYAPPTDGNNVGYLSDEMESDPSDVNGVITQVFPTGGATYRWKRGNGPWKYFTTGLVSGAAFDILSNIGTP